MQTTAKTAFAPSSMGGFMSLKSCIHRINKLNYIISAKSKGGIINEYYHTSRQQSDGVDEY
jgi:hypothetical protein